MDFDRLLCYLLNSTVINFKNWRTAHAAFRNFCFLQETEIFVFYGEQKSNKGCQNIMITLTKLNGTKFVLNCDLIETIQENPDTTIRLSNGNVYIVKEPSDMIVDLTAEYRRGILSGILSDNK